MKLTSTILKNIYNMLVVCEPFDKWNMPLAAQIRFVVDADPDVMGTYLYQDDEKWEHIVTISTKPFIAFGLVCECIWVGRGSKRVNWLIGRGMLALIGWRISVAR